MTLIGLFRWDQLNSRLPQLRLLPLPLQLFLQLLLILLFLLNDFKVLKAQDLRQQLSLLLVAVGQYQFQFPVFRADPKEPQALLKIDGFASVLIAELFPGNDIGLADKAVIDEGFGVSCLDEPDPRALCEAGIAVEGVERDCHIH